MEIRCDRERERGEREREGERGEGGEVEGSRNVYSTLMMTQL